MKKLTYLFLALIIVACSSDGSSNDNASCPSQEEVFNNFEEALSIWQEDSTNVEYCEDYYQAILDVINCSEPPLTKSEIEGWEAILSVLGCP